MSFSFQKVHYENSLPYVCIVCTYVHGWSVYVSSTALVERKLKQLTNPDAFHVVKVLILLLRTTDLICVYLGNILHKISFTNIKCSCVIKKIIGSFEF